MNLYLFQKLYAEGLLKEASFDKIKANPGKQLFSVHWELKTILYLGVLLLTTGLGIVVYKNIDSIGHQVVLLFTASVSAASFLYCFKAKRPFSTGKVESPNSFFDYILLLGCLTFITCIGYLQFEYNFFGNRFGLATFIPMVMLFLTAYYFDHLGILSLGITNLAAWAGITVTPVRFLKENDYASGTLIFTGLLLGALLILAGIVTRRFRIKAHFDFTYTNFGMHVLFISCLAALLYFNSTYLLWFVLLCAVTYYFYRKAVEERSFYFVIILALYLYIGLSYVVIRLLFFTGDFEMTGVYLIFIYFIGSAIWIIRFLIRTNKNLKNHDRLQQKQPG